eukprot:scaffold10448_cov68-Phaeocystis_antarctica.AAC.4
MQTIYLINPEHASPTLLLLNSRPHMTSCGVLGPAAPLPRRDADNLNLLQQHLPTRRAWSLVHVVVDVYQTAFLRPDFIWPKMERTRDKHGAFGKGAAARRTRSGLIFTIIPPIQAWLHPVQQVGVLGLQFDRARGVRGARGARGAARAW